MKTLLEFINNSKAKTYKYCPETKEELKKIIEDRISKEGNECDLNDIDVSKITDMYELFINSNFYNFNGNISNWDVSNVTNMSWMFAYSNFTGDISNWNVSNVTNMEYMFYESKFNQDISNWNVSNVTDMAAMFCDSKFNQDISNWNVANVRDMTYMFEKSPLTGKEPAWYNG